MKKKTNRVVEAILKMNDDRLRRGLIDNSQYEKIRARCLLRPALPRTEAHAPGDKKEGKRTSPLVEAIVEWSEDQLRLGIIDEAEHQKVILHLLGDRRRAPKPAENCDSIPAGAADSRR